MNILVNVRLNKMLCVNEISGKGYVKRTALNARTADLTIAFAVNYNSGGEKLTRTVAGSKYLALPLVMTVRESAIALYRRCRDEGVKTINVAGNGIYTLQRGGNSWTQIDINNYVYQVLKTLTEHHKIEHIVCGGQTGVDLAGAVAAVALGIDTTINMPEGYTQRGINGVDYENTKDDIISQVEKYVLSIEKSV